jgi:hypothetical protein
VLASVCHHVIDWSKIAIRHTPRSDPATPLCQSCEAFNVLIAETTWHQVTFLDLKDKKHTHGNFVREPMQFQTPKDERRHHYLMYCRKRHAYDEAVRYHQEHDDPALPVVSRRGVSLIPSLASRDEPAVEPRKAFYRRKYDDPAPSAVDTPEATPEPPITPEWTQVQSRAEFRHQKKRREQETARHNRAQSEQAVRLRRARDNPPLLVVDRHGVVVKPSLAYPNQPAFELGPHGALQAKQKLKTLTIGEGPRQYIKPTFVAGVLGHTIEVLDNEPHPSMETARGEKCGFLRRKGPMYKPGRYADKEGWYWQDIVDFKDLDKLTGSTGDASADLKDSAAPTELTHEGFGLWGKRNSNKPSTGAAFGFLLGAGKDDEKSGPGNNGKARSLSAGARPAWGMMNRRESSQEQVGSAQSGPSRGAESPLEGGEVLEESRKVTASVARPRQVFSPFASARPRQVIPLFARSVPIGGRGRPPNENDSRVHTQTEEIENIGETEGETEKTGETEGCDIFEDAQENITAEEGRPSEDNDVHEQNKETDEHEVFEDAHESLSPSAHQSRLPQEQETFAFVHFDPFGGDEDLFDSEDDDDGGVDEKNDQHDAVGSAQESLVSAHARRLPQQQQTAFSQADSFGSDEQPEEPKTDGCSVPEGDLARPGRSPPQQSFANYDIFGVDDDLEETEQCGLSESA